MNEFSVIIQTLGAAHVARELNLPPARVNKWAQRDSIPSEYWLDVIAIAADCGLKLTADRLAAIAARRAA